MYYNLILVKVSTEYCDYLRKFDKRVAYNKDMKELRPFIGVLFNIGNIEYFAPLTSPKEKHKTMKNTIDFFKINNGELGAINFNNMIPVTKENYEIINLKSKKIAKEDKNYIELLKDQYKWLNENYMQVQSKACKLYFSYLENKLAKNIKERCCNFALLEKKCEEYIKEINYI